MSPVDETDGEFRDGRGCAWRRMATDDSAELLDIVARVGGNNGRGRHRIGIHRYGFLVVWRVVVAPFAGLEFAVVGAVVLVVARHAGDYEQLSVGKDSVRLIRRAGRDERRYGFQRGWIPVRLIAIGTRPSRRG